MKKCTSCNKNKNKSEFNKKSSRADGLQTICRICNGAASRKYYSKNRKKHLATIKKNKKKYMNSAREWIYNYLLNNSCIDCGETNPIVLEFDHVRGKKDNSISIMIGGGYTLRTIQKEVKKCDVRCANCHRKKTAIDFDWWIIKMGS